MNNIQYHLSFSLLERFRILRNTRINSELRPTIHVNGWLCPVNQTEASFVHLFPDT